VFDCLSLPDELIKISNILALVSAEIRIDSCGLSRCVKKYLFTVFA